MQFSKNGGRGKTGKARDKKEGMRIRVEMELSFRIRINFRMKESAEKKISLEIHQKEKDICKKKPKEIREKID